MTDALEIDFGRTEVNLTRAVAGDDIVVACAPATIDDARLDMTGFDFLAQVRVDPKIRGGGTLLLAPTVTLYSSESDAVMDQWQFVITSAETRTLGPGTYAWEIEWNPGIGGLAKTLAGGLLTIVAEIAHA